MCSSKEDMLSLVRATGVEPPAAVYLKLIFISDEIRFVSSGVNKLDTTTC